ncbi:MAG: depupylase/deamidase Dop [Bowdeniella nasicola]|nr:depupylase/deamidase Dop [Bowdeniella nasicola]
MSVIRPMGIETEYGVAEPGQYANVIELSNAVVAGYADAHPHVPWDYAGEDPLADARGYRLSRAAADPSMLTDDPDRAAPSGRGLRATRVMDPAQRAGARNAVLTNGARLYVDHAHPEYSGPEVSDPLAALIYDRAGDSIVRRSLARLADLGRSIEVYKNNVDGKGASYGTHENYLIDRHLPFGDIVQHLTTFLVTRPLICGAGRVGLGQASEEPGFQISQRADYLESEVGLQTTFNRPIINTRDEPHADARRWRRLHVIVGDANTFDVSTYLKLGVTSLVLWLLERQQLPLDLDALTLSAPVVDAWGVSREPFDHPLSVASGRATALDIQRLFRDHIGHALEADGVWDEESGRVMDTWSKVLDDLATNPADCADRVEWVAKRELYGRMIERGNLSWDHPKIRAADLQWSNLDPRRSLVAALDRAGRVRRLVSETDVERAVCEPPATTRAYLRGEMIRRFPQAVRSASWASLVVDHPDGSGQMRIHLPDPYGGEKNASRDLLESGLSAALEALEG